MSPSAVAPHPEQTNGSHVADAGDDMRKTSFRETAKTAFPRPRVFTDKLEERAFLKFRLAQAFRIFGHLGYDEGVAGHITVRVRTSYSMLYLITSSYWWNAGSHQDRLFLG